MRDPQQVSTCVAPGGQPALFYVPVSGAPWYTVLDRTGDEVVHTSALGVAVTAAKRVLIEQGEVWVRASDDICAHIDRARVATDTPTCPWIRSIAASLDAEGATP